MNRNIIFASLLLSSSFFTYSAQLSLGGGSKGEIELKGQMAQNRNNGATLGLNYSLGSSDESEEVATTPRAGSKEADEHSLLTAVLEEANKNSFKLPKVLWGHVAGYLRTMDNGAAGNELQLVRSFERNDFVKEIRINHTAQGRPYIVVGRSAHVDVYDAVTGQKSSFEHLEKPRKESCSWPLCCLTTDTHYPNFALHTLVNGLFALSYSNKVEVRDSAGNSVAQLPTNRSLVGRQVLMDEQNRMQIVGVEDLETQLKTTLDHVQCNGFAAEHIDQQGNRFVGRYWENGNIEIADAQTKKVVASCVYKKYEIDEGTITPRFSFHRDENQQFHIAVTWQSNEVECFSANDPQAVKLLEHPCVDGHCDFVRTLGYLGNNRMATGSVDGMVRVFDVATGQELQRIKACPGDKIYTVDNIKFDPLRKLMVTTTGDGTVSIWDCAPVKRR